VDDETIPLLLERYNLSLSELYNTPMSIIKQLLIYNKENINQSQILDIQTSKIISVLAGNDIIDNMCTIDDTHKRYIKLEHNLKRI